MQLTIDFIVYLCICNTSYCVPGYTLTLINSTDATVNILSRHE